MTVTLVLGCCEAIRVKRFGTSLALKRVGCGSLGCALCFLGEDGIGALAMPVGPPEAQTGRGDVNRPGSVCQDRPGSPTWLFPWGKASPTFFSGPWSPRSAWAVSLLPALLIQGPVSLDCELWSQKHRAVLRVVAQQLGNQLWTPHCHFVAALIVCQELNLSGAQAPHPRMSLDQAPARKHFSS